MSSYKVTGAPETIWLNYGELEHDDTHAALLRSGEATWCEDMVFDSDVKYVRADLAASPQPPHTEAPAAQDEREALPPLPESFDRWSEPSYTAEQMREYALAARAPRPASDERRRFEDWLRSIWTPGYACPRDGDGYVDKRAQELWQAWRAGAALAPQAAAELLLPAEAVFAFAAWLTARREAVTFSASHGAAPGAELAAAFCESQGLLAAREDFPSRLKPYPVEAETTQAAPQPTAQADAGQGDMLAALKIAEQFMVIASDWNMDEAEINGEMRSTCHWLAVVRTALAAQPSGESK